MAESRAGAVHDIIDNRERKLADSIKPLLSESERAKFAVGYFFISGFKLVADELARLKELRLLVGNVSDGQTVEQLAETHSATQVLERIRKRDFANRQERAKVLAEVGQTVRQRLENLSQTDDDERIINLLLTLIRENRFLVRVYTKSRLHAKACIFDYPADRYDRGMAKRATPAADTSALEREIDQRVYRLYGVTPEEIKIVEDASRA